MERATSGTGEPEHTKANTMTDTPPEQPPAAVELRKRLADYAEEHGLDDELDELLLADGLEEAFLGYGCRVGEPPIAIYDTTKVFDLLIAQGLTLEQAREHFDHNIGGAWVGDGTPMFMIKV